MKRDERGIALVITLFLMASLSALAVSLMFLSQTETASSRNYKTMSQARYAGEAGVHKSINYIINSYSSPASPFTGYDVSKSPVTCTSGCTNTTAGTCNASTPALASSTGCIVLSTLTGVASNYPDAAVRTAFATAGGGSLATNASGSTTNTALGTVTYKTAAILMSMRQVNSWGGAGVIQTWQVIAEGSAGQNGTVQVSGTLEREYGDSQTFAVFATGTGCGAIDLQGNVQTASYDGSSVSNSGGNVGTNGNMSIGGHVDVHGSLSSPRSGVGTCTDGTNVTALTESGAASVDNNAVVQLPQALTFDTPAAPSPMPGTSSSPASSVCATVIAQGALCTMSGSTAVIDPLAVTVTLGNISGNFSLKAGKYNFNSVGSGNITYNTSGTNGTAPIVINLAGKTSTGTDMATVFDLNGQAVINAGMDASKFQVIYGGTGGIEMTGGSTAAFMVYAPNGHVTTHGNADIYGSILAKQVTSAGTPRFIYDTRLKSTFFTVGNYVMSSFSWKKY